MMIYTGARASAATTRDQPDRASSAAAAAVGPAGACPCCCRRCCCLFLQARCNRLSAACLCCFADPVILERFLLRPVAPPEAALKTLKPTAPQQAHQQRQQHVYRDCQHAWASACSVTLDQWSQASHSGRLVPSSTRAPELLVTLPTTQPPQHTLNGAASDSMFLPACQVCLTSRL